MTVTNPYKKDKTNSYKVVKVAPYEGKPKTRCTFSRCRRELYGREHILVVRTRGALVGKGIPYCNETCRQDERLKQLVDRDRWKTPED
jgi:hypothetical protein